MSGINANTSSQFFSAFAPKNANGTANDDPNAGKAAAGQAAISFLTGTTDAILKGMDLKFKFDSDRMDIMHKGIMHAYSLAAKNAANNVIF
jgi:hypothetical protein